VVIIAYFTLNLNFFVNSAYLIKEHFYHILPKDLNEVIEFINISQKLHKICIIANIDIYQN